MWMPFGRKRCAGEVVTTETISVNEGLHTRKSKYISFTCNLDMKMKSVCTLTSQSIKVTTLLHKTIITIYPTIIILYLYTTIFYYALHKIKTILRIIKKSEINSVLLCNQNKAYISSISTFYIFLQITTSILQLHQNL